MTSFPDIALDLRTELYQIVYEKPIYPKNLYLKRAPMKHAEYREKVIKRQIRLPLFLFAVIGQRVKGK